MVITVYTNFVQPVASSNLQEVILSDLPVRKCVLFGWVVIACPLYLFWGWAMDNDMKKWYPIQFCAAWTCQSGWREATTKADACLCLVEGLGLGLLNFFWLRDPIVSVLQKKQEQQKNPQVTRKPSFHALVVSSSFFFWWPPGRFQPFFVDNWGHWPHWHRFAGLF